MTLTEGYDTEEAGLWLKSTEIDADMEKALEEARKVYGKGVEWEKSI